MLIFIRILVRPEGLTRGHPWPLALRAPRKLGVQIGTPADLSNHEYKRRSFAPFRRKNKKAHACVGFFIFLVRPEGLTRGHPWPLALRAPRKLGVQIGTPADLSNHEYKRRSFAPFRRKNKKAHACVGFFIFLVRPEGFEPPTT